MFDKMKKQMENMQNQNMGSQQNNSASMDPNDPLMEPIEGITLEKFAEISANLGKQGKMNLDDVIPYVEKQGVKSGTWQTVQAGWMGRIQSNQTMGAYYGTLFGKFMSS